MQSPGPEAADELVGVRLLRRVRQLQPQACTCIPLLLQLSFPVHSLRFVLQDKVHRGRPHSPELLAAKLALHA